MILKKKEIFYFFHWESVDNLIQIVYKSQNFKHIMFYFFKPTVYTIKTVANPINGSYVSEIRILDFLDFTFPLISYLTLSFNIKNLSCQNWQVKWYQIADIGMQRKNWPKKGVGMHEGVCSFLVFLFFLFSGVPVLTS